MKEYGFDVEFVLDIESKSIGVKQADLAKISYFKNAADKLRFEKDRAHKFIEQTLYPSAIDSVIWISGRTHSLMLND